MDDHAAKNKEIIAAAPTPASIAGGFCCKATTTDAAKSFDKNNDKAVVPLSVTNKYKPKNIIRNRLRNKLLQNNLPIKLTTLMPTKNDAAINNKTAAIPTTGLTTKEIG